jgi:predicted nuclease with TOPRIM domain
MSGLPVLKFKASAMKAGMKQLQTRLTSVSENLKRIIAELAEPESTSHSSLQSLAEELQKITAELDDVVEHIRSESENSSNASMRRSGSANHSELIDSLRVNGRDSAVQVLSTLKQAELGTIYIQLGGASRDKKKPKDWLIERILFKLFDFQSGHEMLRGN